MRNEGLKILILMGCLLFAFSSHGQIITKVGSKYFHNGKTYDIRTLGYILNNSEEAHYLYERSMKSQKVADILGYTSLGTLAVSGVFLFRASKAEGFLGGLGDAIAGGLFLSIGTISGIVGVLAKSSQQRRIKHAVNHYNWEVDQGIMEETTSVDLGISGNGLGLIFTF